jgi:hypothetical protein
MAYNPEINRFQGGLFDSPEATGYIQAHGTFPPFISEGATPEFLQEQIESMRKVAECSTDHETSEKLVHEIGYLTDILARFNH